MISLTVTPFVIIGGGLILNALKIQEGAFIFACLMGGATIIINYIIGVMLIIAGHTELKTFKDI